MAATRRLHTLLWLAVLVGIGYGVHAWGGRLIVGLRGDGDLVEELIVGFAAMPLYVPAFLALYLVYRDLPAADWWTGATCVLYVATIIGLEVAGGNPHENHELITGAQISAVAFALPVCTVMSCVLAWRAVRAGASGSPIRVERPERSKRGTPVLP